MSTNNIVVRHQFQATEILSCTYQGRPVVLAQQVGQALGYANTGKVSEYVGTKWAAEFVEGFDYFRLGVDEINALREAFPGLGIASRTSNLTLLTPSGADLVAIHSRTKRSVLFRRWIVDEVLPTYRAQAQAAQQGITREEVAVIAATVVRTVLDEMSRTTPAPKGVVERVAVPDGLRAGQIARQFATSVARVNAAVRALTSQYGTLGRKGPRTGWHEGETPYYNDLEVQEIRRVLIARGWVSPVREMDVETLFGDKAKGDKVH